MFHPLAQPPREEWACLAELAKYLQGWPGTGARLGPPRPKGVKGKERGADVTLLLPGHCPSSGNLLPVIRRPLGPGDELVTCLQVFVISFYVVSYEQERKCCCL